MKMPVSTFLTFLIAVTATSAFGRGLNVNTATDVPLATVIDDALEVKEYNSDWMVMLGQGGSMDPYYRSGSVLLVSPTAFRNLKPEMMVVFRDADGDLVGHRLVRQEANGWVTQGVNNRVADPELMSQKEYIGVIFGVLNSSGADQQGLAYARQLGLNQVLGKSR